MNKKVIDHKSTLYEDIKKSLVNISLQEDTDILSYVLRNQVVMFRAVCENDIEHIKMVKNLLNYYTEFNRGRNNLCDFLIFLSNEIEVN